MEVTTNANISTNTSTISTISKITVITVITVITIRTMGTNSPTHTATTIRITINIKTITTTTNTAGMMGDTMVETTCGDYMVVKESKTKTMMIIGFDEHHVNLKVFPFSIYTAQSHQVTGKRPTARHIRTNYM